eukprot:1159013-Pelagomonas_calceolata.AAC.6
MKSKVPMRCDGGLESCGAFMHRSQAFVMRVQQKQGARKQVVRCALAGASKVYAVEASGIVGYTQQLADGNADMGKTLQVIHAKVEEVDIAEKVDVLISEPMGTLLVNERMLETYLYARDRFLKPGGKMFPVRFSCVVKQNKRVACVNIV